MTNILLSIITINYNNSPGLEKTIKSISTQTYKDFEYIIIDGASTDTSIDCLKQFSDEIDVCISEKDAGIYNAMNKGISKAQGEYLFFLNSGDYLKDDLVLEKVKPLLHTTDIVYGNLLIKESSKEWIKEYPALLYFSHFFYDSLPHSGGSFCRKKLFTDTVGFYDENLKIAADWKWFLISLFKFNCTYKHINKTLSVFDYSGVSYNNEDIIKQEKTNVFNAEFPVIFKEISELQMVKNKYMGLSNSRFLKTYLKLKKVAEIYKGKPNI